MDFILSKIMQRPKSVVLIPPDINMNLEDVNESSPNRAKNNSSIDSSQVSSENNSLIHKNSDENFLETTADASLLTGFNNLNIATPKSQKSSLLLEPISNTCPSSDDESFAECNSFNVTQNDETEVSSTQTVLNDVSSQLNKTTEVKSYNCDEYDPLDEIECFSIDRKLLVQNPANTTHFEDYSYISSSGLPGNSNVNETFDDSSLNDFEKTVIEEERTSCEVDSLKELAVKSVNSLNHNNSEVTNLVACDSGIAVSEISVNVCTANEQLDEKIVSEEPMDVDESIYEPNQTVPISGTLNQTFEEPKKVPGEPESITSSGSLNQTFDETEKISEITETVKFVEQTIEPLTENENVTEIPQIVPVSTNLNETFEEPQKNSKLVSENSDSFKETVNDPESVSISEKVNQTFEESQESSESTKEQELDPEISDLVPISEKLNQTFEEPSNEQELLPEVSESVQTSEKLNQTFEEPQDNSEPLNEQALVPEISDSIPEQQNNSEEISETLGSSNQTVIESDSVPISEQLNQTFEEPEKIPEISSKLNQTFDEPDKIVEESQTVAEQQLNQTFEPAAVFEEEIMPEQQIDQTNERRLSIRSDLFESPQSTPIKERSQSALSQNNNSEVFVEQKLQENLDVTFKTPAIPGGSGFFNMRKSGGVVAAEDEEFQSSNKFSFGYSDFDFLANKRSSDIPADDRDSLLLRFDPLLGVPVPVISAPSKLISTIEEETNNSNCVGAGAVVEEQIGDCAMTNVDMKIENMSDIKTSLDDKQDYKMAELDKKMKNEHLKTEDTEKMLKDAEAREEILLKRITEKDKAMTRMCFVVEEYEKAIAELIAEKEQIQQESDQLKKVADTNGLHLASLEDTFSDLHAKYEKSKQFTISLKDREESLLIENKKARESLVQQEQRYDQMKNHAIQQLDHANVTLASMEKTHAIDLTKLKANLKKAELSSQSLTEQLQQKTRENEELVKICDELIGTPS